MKEDLIAMKLDENVQSTVSNYFSFAPRRLEKGPFIAVEDGVYQAEVMITLSTTLAEKGEGRMEGGNRSASQGKEVIYLCFGALLTETLNLLSSLFVIYRGSGRLRALFLERVDAEPGDHRCQDKKFPIGTFAMSAKPDVSHPSSKIAVPSSVSLPSVYF